MRKKVLLNSRYSMVWSSLKPLSTRIIAASAEGMNRVKDAFRSSVVSVETKERMIRRSAPFFGIVNNPNHLLFVIKDKSG
jgi:hypothetical protein